MRKIVELFRPQQRHKILIGKQFPYRLGHEDQPVSGCLRLSDQKSLSVHIFPIGTYQCVRRQGLVTPAGIILESFASASPLLDEALGRDELVATQQLLLIGLLEDDLDSGIVGSGDLDRDANRNLSGLDGTQQSMLTRFKEPDDAPYIFGVFCKSSG